MVGLQIEREEEEGWDDGKGESNKKEEDGKEKKMRRRGKERRKKRAYFELVNESVSIEDIVSKVFEHLTVWSFTQSKHVKRPVVHSLPQHINYSFQPSFHYFSDGKSIRKKIKHEENQTAGKSESEKYLLLWVSPRYEQVFEWGLLHTIDDKSCKMRIVSLLLLEDVQKMFQMFIV